MGLIPASWADWVREWVHSLFETEIENEVYMRTERERAELGLTSRGYRGPLNVQNSIALREAVVRSLGATTPMGLSHIRDMYPAEQENNAELAFWFFRQNPNAKRAVELTADYVVGTGITYTAQSSRVQAILDRFWDDEQNGWRSGIYTRCRDLGLFGEICIPVQTSDKDGSVVLGQLDPYLIEAVITDARNGINPYAVLIRPEFSHFYGTQRTTYAAYKIIRKDPGSGMYRGLAMDEGQAEKWGHTRWEGKIEYVRAQGYGRGGAGAWNAQVYPVQWIGSCFYKKVNSPNTSVRGWSDLQASMEWLEGGERFMMASIQKGVNSANFVVDIEMEGATPKQIADAEARDKVKLSPGGKIYHNERTKITIPTVDLKSDDVEKIASVIKAHAMSGMGIPLIWMGENSTNRSASQELTDAPNKRIATRQRDYVDLLQVIFGYAIDAPVDAGYAGIDKDDDRSFYLKLPDISANDQRLSAVSIKNVADALDKMIQSGAKKPGEAAEIFDRYIDQMGINIGKDMPKSDDGGGGEDIAPILLLASDGGPDEMVGGGFRYYFTGKNRKQINEFRESVTRGG